jgi:hypothetical protein
MRDRTQDEPRFVTDEPGLDPVTGRPWGEETPAKRVWGSILLIAMGLGAVAWLIVASPPLDTPRSALAYAAAPAVIIFAALRLRGELRDRNER